MYTVQCTVVLTTMAQKTRTSYTYLYRENERNVSNIIFFCIVYNVQPTRHHIIATTSDRVEQTFRRQEVYNPALGIYATRSRDENENSIGASSCIRAVAAVYRLYGRDVARCSYAYFIGLHPFCKHGNDWFLLCPVQFYPMRAAVHWPAMSMSFLYAI